MRPTIGRIVHYKLCDGDIEMILRRRTDGSAIRAGLEKGTWPRGAQAHIGNRATVGDVLPMMICRVWPNEFGTEHDGVNGQVFLDGCDVLWVTSVGEGNNPGQWVWPPRV